MDFNGEVKERNIALIVFETRIQCLNHEASIVMYSTTRWVYGYFRFGRGVAPNHKRVKRALPQTAQDCYSATYRYGTYSTGTNWYRRWP